LRAFPPYLSLQIQNSKINTFSKVYRQAVSTEAYLILVGKLPSHMPMPYFPMLAQNQPLRSHSICTTPPLASIPTPIHQFPLTLPAPRAPLDLLALPQPGINQGNPTLNESQELKSLCRNMANQITLLSR